MVSAGQVGWGRYSVFEGPVFFGHQKLRLVEPHDSDNMKLMQVITATEGGAFDAVNMYDKCIMTVGVIQWCDAAPQLSVCDMLGALDAAGCELTEIRQFADKIGYSLGRTPGGKFRFIRAGGNAVDTQEEQRQLYFGGSSGRQGAWSAQHKTHARIMAAAMASSFQGAREQQAQIDFTAPKLTQFAGANGRKVFFSESSPKGPLMDAMRAAYLSYAANLPVVADRMLGSVGTDGIGTEKWAFKALQKMAFGPGIALYPERYNKIRPHLERLYGVDLPDFARDIQKALDNLGKVPSADFNYVKGIGIDPNFGTVKDVQRALLHLGYDLGPRRDDGNMGAKTTGAIKEFQRSANLEDDGAVGRLTRAALIDALLAKG